MPIISSWRLSAELAALPLFAPDVLEVGDLLHVQVPALPVLVGGGGRGGDVGVQGVEGGRLGRVNILKRIWNNKTLSFFLSNKTIWSTRSGNCPVD